MGEFSLRAYPFRINLKNMLKVLLKNYQLVLAWGLFFIFCSTLISVLLPRQYSAESQILIISRDNSGVDPYTQSRSAEKIGENLGQIMKTSDFYKRVMDNSLQKFDRNQWDNLTEKKKRKKWAKDIQSSMVYGAGIMNIKAYSYSKGDAVNLANAVAKTLSSQGWEYVGGNVIIKVVSAPIYPSFPARPSFVLNILAGFVLGVLLSGSWVVKYKKRYLFT
ncbi:MAG: Wzz/FepE/Etk N-terminal domain-containing protein [bacterium]